MGQLLLERGLIRPPQLDEALQCQVAFGGRLGTNLVELGYVNLGDVARVLSDQHEIPLAPEEWLVSPDPQALQAVPRNLIQRLKILPLRIEPRVLHVAMLDPRNTQHIDDISFAASREVRAYLVPELSLYAWLERHCGIQRETRYIHVSQDLERGRFTEPAVPAASAASAASAAGTTPRPVLSIGSAEPDIQAILQPLDWGQELTDENTFLDVYEATSERAIEAAPSVTRVVRGQPEPNRAQPFAAEDGLIHAQDRDAVIGAALRLAAVYTQYAGLFIVHRGRIEGVRFVTAAGGDRPLDGVSLPMTSESTIALAARTGEVVRARPIAGAGDEPLFAALGRKRPAELAVFPVKIKGRVVNTLLVDNGPDPIPRTAFAALAVLPELISEAYERLILLNKQG